jgi:hypothetical protein
MTSVSDIHRPRPDRGFYRGLIFGLVAVAVIGCAGVLMSLWLIA